MSRKKTQNKTNIILNRISEHYHLTNDDDIASFYNVSASTVSSWRTRDSINERLIRAKCDDENLANWFINGIKTQEKQNIPISDVQSSYNQNTSAPDIEILLAKTKAVIHSPSIFSTALKSNIEAFHTAIRFEGEIDNANRKINDLENKMKSIEDRLLPLEKIS